MPETRSKRGTLARLLADPHEHLLADIIADLSDIFASTGNPKVRDAIHSLTSKGRRGPRGLDDGLALDRMARLLVDGDAKTASDAARKVTASIRCHSTRSNIMRLARKFRMDSAVLLEKARSARSATTLVASYGQNYAAWLAAKGLTEEGSDEGTVVGLACPSLLLPAELRPLLRR